MICVTSISWPTLHIFGEQHVMTFMIYVRDCHVMNLIIHDYQYSALTYYQRLHKVLSGLAEHKFWYFLMSNFGNFLFEETLKGKSFSIYGQDGWLPLQVQHSVCTIQFFYIKRTVLRDCGRPHGILLNMLKL
jgi:hypothetical protein